MQSLVVLSHFPRETRVVGVKLFVDIVQKGLALEVALSGREESDWFRRETRLGKEERVASCHTCIRNCPRRIDENVRGFVLS